MLQLKNVEKIYKTKAGDTHALKDVSLNFQESGLVFINGKSGSGKTTLLNVIGGLDSVDSGEIIIDGKSFDSFTLEEYDAYRNTYVGFIFQEYNLLSDFSVEKNIEIATELQGRNIEKQEIIELLERFEIEWYIDRDPSQLSGGQRQRVAIARALIKNPQIIIADEPTGALDSQTGKQVIELLKKLSKDTLVIVVSHDDELAKNYADRIITLKDGRVESDVTVKDVELNTAVYKTEAGVIVKSGAKLNQEETERLVQAVADKKSVELTDKISIREECATDQTAFNYTEKQVELVNSKMKLKSAALLGLKFLKVKPLRLVFTVLLSMIAFSVFGLFSTVASYTQAKAMADIIRSSEYTGVSLTSKYKLNEDDEYNIKISQQEIDNLNKKTGFNFRGVYDINDKFISQNKDKEIFELNSSNISVGKNYYHKTVNGFVEFKKSEISKNSKNQDVIDKDGFNNTVIAGRYPTKIDEVAITDYTALSIIKYSKDNDFKYCGETVSVERDLVGKSLSFISPTVKFTIVGIVETEKIPNKFDELQTATYNASESLTSELKAYLNNGLYMSLFVCEGFTEDYMAKNNRRPLYYGVPANYSLQYNNSPAEFAARTGNEAFYATSVIDKDNLLLIDNQNKENFSLKKGETIIAVNNLHYLYSFERDKKIDKDSQAKLDKYWSDLLSSSSSVDKQKALDNYVNLKVQLLGGGDKIKTLQVTQTEKSTGNKNVLSLKVVGVYFGINTDLTSSTTWLPITLSSEDLTTFKIYGEQGEYSRIISPSSTVKKSCKALAKFATADRGVTYTIFQNDVYQLLEQGEEMINKVSDLFLYVSLVMAAFSVLMLLNYISSSIVAKRQTIGVLKGLGASKRDVFRTFIIEGLILSIVIGILSIGVSYAGCYLVNYYVRTVMEIPLKIAIFEMLQALIIFASSVLTGFISSIIPILKITKESPVNLIRKS